MTRRRLLASALAVALVGAAARADIVDRLDEPAPQPECSRWWNGAAPRLEALRGKVVVLHVSDPARATSKAFSPNLSKLVAQWQSQPVVFLEVATSDSEDVVERYVAESDGEVRWPVGWDSGSSMDKGYPGSSVPRTYVIGPDGKIVWHAHIGALKKDVIESQVSRCAFYDPKAIPEKARPVAKAMLEMKFGDAVVAADKVFGDRFADEDARRIAVNAKKEVSRYFEFQTRMVDALTAELDWATVYRRVERMRVVYKGTIHEEAVEARWVELNSNKRVLYIVKEQRRLDEMVSEIHRLGRTELEKLLTRVREIADMNPETQLGKNALDWIAEIERRIAKFVPKK